MLFYYSNTFSRLYQAPISASRRSKASQTRRARRKRTSAERLPNPAKRCLRDKGTGGAVPRRTARRERRRQGARRKIRQWRPAGLYVPHYLAVYAHSAPAEHRRYGGDIEHPGCRGTSSGDFERAAEKQICPVGQAQQGNILGGAGEHDYPRAY